MKLNPKLLTKEVRSDDRDTGAIHSSDDWGRVEAVASITLSSFEADLSLPDLSLPSRQLVPLTNLLGKEYTVESRAWTMAALPDMRGLQKALVEHSLTLPKEDRTDCRVAIMAVEYAVKLRVRLQHMRMSEIELAMAKDAAAKEGGKGEKGEKGESKK